MTPSFQHGGTEAQRGYLYEDLTREIIAAAIECTALSGRASWKTRTKSAFVMSFTCGALAFEGK
jgi:hypothetical protein